MPDSETLKFLVPAMVAIAGWFAAHQFNVHRDRQNKRRDMRIQFLLDAYRRLESAANRLGMTEEQKLEFESAVADIQLLGTKEQVATTIAFLRQHEAGSGANIDSVLQLLRKDLREELGLAGEVGHARIFRFTRES